MDGDEAREHYELGKTPSDTHQQEADSFAELIVRTQRNFIDITQGSVGGPDGQDALERQRDVARALEESEAPDETAPLFSVPLCSKVTAADPLRVLGDACVTMEDEETLRLAAAAVARALTGGLALRDVGRVVDQLPPIVF